MSPPPETLLAWGAGVIGALLAEFAGVLTSDLALLALCALLGGSGGLCRWFGQSLSGWRSLLSSVLYGVAAGSLVAAASRQAGADNFVALACAMPAGTFGARMLDAAAAVVLARIRSSSEK